MEVLNGACPAEHAGNWWLGGRFTEYQFDGRHELAATYGRREGQSGVLRVNFDEVNWKFEIHSGRNLSGQREAIRNPNWQVAQVEQTAAMEKRY